MIRFEKWEGRAEILSPLRGFEREVHVLEYRRDPLTGQVSIVAKGRSGYVMRYFRSDEELLRELVEKTRENCPFCPDAIERETPRFPPEVLPEGRLRLGDCWVVPALFPHADLNAIVVLGPDHFRKPGELGRDLLRDGLLAGIELIRRARGALPDLKHAAIIMNYLPTGGSSQLHPHMQVLASQRPFNYVGALLSKSLDYYLAYSRCFWKDLVEEEARLGRRLLGRIGPTWWLAPFAPMRRYEVLCLVEDVSSLLEVPEETVAHVADGVSRVLRFYSDQGIWAFNMAVLSGPLDGGAKEFFWLQVRICARFGLGKKFLSDLWALPALLDTDEVFEAPEDYALKIKPYFQESRAGEADPPSPA